MAKKRKRPGKSWRNRGPTTPSQPSITASASAARFKCTKAPTVQNDLTSHPVISLYYREVLTLRDYLLRQLPISSKLRRRRIISLSSSKSATRCENQPLADLLDATLVGVLKKPSLSVVSERQRDLRIFTESQSRSILGSTDTGPTSPQSEVCL